MPVPACSRFARGLILSAWLLALIASAADLFSQEPAGRFNHTAVWTGTEMIVWGGRGTNGLVNTGGRYNPTTRVWTAVNTNGAPSPREYHVAEWTGTEMIVWGGEFDPYTLYNNGARYNPVTDTWTSITNLNAPLGRAYHSSAWTGTHAIIWGGSSNSSANGEIYYNSGSRYSPVSNSWAVTTNTGAPVNRQDHTAVWTGDRMIIWGGLAKEVGAPEPSKTNSGALYNPTNNTWSATATAGAPSARASHVAVWTGSRMIVWGGVGTITSTDIYNTGGRYDPVANSWAATSTNAGVPTVRQDHTAVWTGSEMIVWGGQGSIGNYRDTGGRYNPTTDTWTATALNPAARAYHSAVWTGTEMIVWGGYGFGATPLQGLARYRPVENTWNTAPLCSLTAPANSSTHGSSSNVVITADATDADGSVNQVQFFDGATLLGTDTIAPYTNIWSGGSAGVHALTAVATDNAGLKTTSAPVTVTIIGPPAVALTSPANAATFLGGSTIALAATATPAAGASVTQVQFYDGAVLLSTDTTSPYDFSWSGAGSGAHTLTARVLDNFGTVVTSAPVAITVYSPPTTSITAPAGGSTFGSTSNLTITANANDSDGTVSQVEFFDGAVLIGSDNTSPYSQLWSGGSPGVHTLTTVATDNTGYKATSAPVSVTLIGPPVVDLTGLTEGSVYPTGTPVSLTANAAAGGGASVVQVQFYDGTTLLNTDTTSPYGFIWADAGTGAHTVTARVLDSLGMTATSGPVTITINTAPTTGITSPASGLLVPENTPVTIDATAADTDGTVTQVAFYDGNTLLAVTNAAPYRFDWASVPAGQRVLTTRAMDNLGTVSTSAPVTLTANALPLVAATTPLNGSQVAANEPILLVANASDTDGSITQVQFRMDGALLGNDNSVPYSINWTNAALGFHTLTVVATDNNGMSRTTAPVTIEAVIRPLLVSSWASNRIWVTLTGGETGRTYVVQVSTNMQTWTPFRTNVATNGTFTVTDPAGSALLEQRYYRVDP